VLLARGEVMRPIKATEKVRAALSCSLREQSGYLPKRKLAELHNA
jgi:hypothetical protein